MFWSDGNDYVVRYVLRGRGGRKIFFNLGLLSYIRAHNVPAYIYIQIRLLSITIPKASSISLIDTSLCKSIRKKEVSDVLTGVFWRNSLRNFTAGENWEISSCHIGRLERLSQI